MSVARRCCKGRFDRPMSKIESSDSDMADADDLWWRNSTILDAWLTGDPHGLGQPGKGNVVVL